jgi:transcriptional regulator with XRE-family HTH domain
MDFLQQSAQPDAQAFAQRMQSRRIALSLRKQELAAMVGVSLTTIQQYENGQYPKGEFAVRLAAALQCSLDWLLAGRGGLDERIDAQNAEHFVAVPVVGARLHQGKLLNNAEDAGQYAFSHAFLCSKGQPESMVLLRVAGESMAPQILHNDLVLIDQSQCQPVPDALYAVSMEAMIYIKQVNALPGRLVLHSANPAYGDIAVENPEQLSTLVHIIGRAVWLGRALP